jgi:serine phosphatase RsbU (regulator of sigma subunit)/Tfp pilus assembly protein PilF
MGLSVRSYRIPPFVFLLIGLMVHLGVHAQQSTLERALAVQSSYPDSCLKLLETAYAEAVAGHDSTLMGKVRNVSGTTNWFLGRYPEAMRFLQMALGIRRSIHDSVGIATTLNNIGLVHWKQGQMKEAMDAYLASMTISEQQHDTVGLARSIGNIGILYIELGDRKKGLEYYQRSLPYVQASGNMYLLSNTMNNIGLVYQEEEDHEKALYYLRQSRKLAEENQNGFMLAQSINNIGISLKELGRLDEAMPCFTEAKEAYLRLGDTCSASEAIGNQGMLHQLKGESEKAVTLSQTALTLAKPCGELKVQLHACKVLYEIYLRRGEHAQALRYHQLYSQLKDSINNNARMAEIMGLDMNYRFARETALRELEQEKELAIAEGKIRQQRQARNASLAIGALILGMLALLARNFRQKQKDNAALSALNAEIGRKNTEITDSIGYARHLQQAVLPGQPELERLLPKALLLFRPKDIVSGDFYWVHEVDGTRFVAVADCTGHGVPGAMVSMVGVQGLEKAVTTGALRSPAQILHALDEHMDRTFGHSAATVRDGMDIGLCAIGPDGAVIFSGANRPLWIFRQLTGQIEEVRPVKRSVGGRSQSVAFIDHPVAVSAADRLILFSDGFQDQFGGPDGKKLGSRRMRTIICEALSAEDVKDVDLGAHLTHWQGHEEQVDDITLLMFGI